MARERILIVDHEPKMISLIRQVFSGSGYSTMTATKGDQALATAAQQQPSLVILDVDLKGEIDGFEVTHRLREFSDVPIILLSSTDNSEDMLRGYALGADDYIVKPFDSRILQARARVLLKRSTHQVEEPDEIVCNNLTINQAARRVTVNDIEVYLTETEYNLLLELARHHDRVLLHDQLLATVWGKEFRNEVSYLRSYIHTLRRKIENDPTQPRLIISRPGIGYMLTTTDQDGTTRN